MLETLEPLSGDRKCFRLINGVLVERTVKDVVPALKTNQEGLKKVLDDMVKQYKSKQDELDKWKVCWHCRPLKCPKTITLTCHSTEKAQRSSRSSMMPMLAWSLDNHNRFESMKHSCGATRFPEAMHPM